MLRAMKRPYKMAARDRKLLLWGAFLLAAFVTVIVRLMTGSWIGAAGFLLNFGYLLSSLVSRRG